MGEKIAMVQTRGRGRVTRASKPSLYVSKDSFKAPKRREYIPSSKAEMQPAVVSQAASMNTGLKMSYQWCMPDRNTFSMPPVNALLKRYMRPNQVVLDPFARDSKWGTITNDINACTSAQYHMDAVKFLDAEIKKGTQADVVLLDPPYSPFQMKEVYDSAGLDCKQLKHKVYRRRTDRGLSNALLYKRCKDRLDRILRHDGVAISFGWSSSGFGLNRDYKKLEIVMLGHGAAHHDTIIVVERKMSPLTAELTR